MGGSLGDLTVTADSARHLGDDAVVLSKKQFTAAGADKYVITLILHLSSFANMFYWADT